LPRWSTGWGNCGWCGATSDTKDNAECAALQEVCERRWKVGGQKQGFSQKQQQRITVGTSAFAGCVAPAANRHAY